MDNGASSYRRFLDGDDNGIVEIIRDYKDGLMLYLNSFVNNICIAEDITENTFIKLVVKKPRFRRSSSFKTWLYAIGRNVALDYLRKATKVSFSSIDDYPNLSNEEADIEKSYIKEERKIAVHKALKMLNPEYSQVLYLSYFENFSNSQIAEIMKKSSRQIENLIYRAKLSLKSTLNKEGFLYEEL